MSDALKHSSQRIQQKPFFNFFQPFGKAEEQCLVATNRVGLNDGSLKFKTFISLDASFNCQSKLSKLIQQCTLEKRISVKDDLFCETSCSALYVIVVRIYTTLFFHATSLFCCKHQLDTNIIRCSQQLTVKERNVIFGGAPECVIEGKIYCAK